MLGQAAETSETQQGTWELKKRWSVAGDGRIVESKLVSENHAAWKAENELGAANSRCYSWGAVEVCTGAV